MYDGKTCGKTKSSAVQRCAMSRRSDDGDRIRLQALASVDHLDADALARSECFDAAAAQGGDVDEHILAATVGRDEPVALVGLEPFDRAFHAAGRAPSAAVDAESR